MWLAVLFLALAAGGCGRLGFEPFGESMAGTDAAEADATSPTCTGHDEDADGFPDACDNCPSVANPGQEDRGEVDAGNMPDAVGDACDPRPTATGDRIAKFASYATDPLAALETVGTVTWDDTDVLHLGVAGDFGQVRFTASVQFTRAELRYRIGSLAPGTMYGGLWTHITGNLENSLFPQIAADVGSGLPFIYIKESIPTAAERNSPLVFMTRELVVGDELVTLHDTALATGGPERFSITFLSTDEQLTAELDGVTRPFTGVYELEAVNFGMDIAYLVLYDTQ